MTPKGPIKSQKMPGFRWSEKSELAVSLLVQGDMTHAQIGERVGVNRKTLFDWRNHPNFAARVDLELMAYRSEVRRIGIAQLERRVEAINRRWVAMQRVIIDRADDPTMKTVPGGPSGLLVRSVKGVGRGDDFRLVETFEVDTGLLRELREHEKQAAQELGQWTIQIEGITKPATVDEAAAERAMIAAATEPDD